MGKVELDEVEPTGCGSTLGWKVTRPVALSGCKDEGMEPRTTVVVELGGRVPLCETGVKPGSRLGTEEGVCTVFLVGSLTDVEDISTNGC